MSITPGEILRFPRYKDRKVKKRVGKVANHSALGWAESIK